MLKTTKRSTKKGRPLFVCAWLRSGGSLSLRGLRSLRHLRHRFAITCCRQAPHSYGQGAGPARYEFRVAGRRRLWEGPKCRTPQATERSYARGWLLDGLKPWPIDTKEGDYQPFDFLVTLFYLTSVSFMLLWHPYSPGQG